MVDLPPTLRQWYLYQQVIGLIQQGKLEVRKYHLECPEDLEEERRRDELEEEFMRECKEYGRERAEEELSFESPKSPRR